MSLGFVCVVFGLAWGAPPVAGPVVARVAGEPVTAAEVRRYLQRQPGPTPTDRASVAAALGRAIAARALAVEATLLLGARVAGLDAEAASQLLLTHLFDPGRRCARIPEPARRRAYAETRWRFVAPPAWRVQDIQLLCCRDRRRCGSPEVVACLDETRQLAVSLRATLPDRLGGEAYEAAYVELARDVPGLAFKEYAFFHDPERPGEPMDWRLQDVDAPIAEATPLLAPGEISPPIVTRFGHHILRLVERRERIALRFDDERVQAVLRTELCPGWLLELRQRYARDLLAQSPPTIDQAACERAFGVAP